MSFPTTIKALPCGTHPKLSPPASIEDDLWPISLMSQIAKVMEGFTLDSLLNEVGNKLDTKQFALPRKSTTQALVYLLHLTLAGLDVGHCSARLFFADFRKRFDLVGYNTIIAELENLKVYPAIIRWVKVFLTGRAQCVKFGMATSSWKRDALRQAKNSCSSKRFLAFSERFWERKEFLVEKRKRIYPAICCITWRGVRILPEAL